MAKNKKIEKYLDTPKNLRRFKDGLNLYLQFSIKQGLKNKLVIGGDTPNNRTTLEAELIKLAEIDPRQIEAEKEKIAEAKKEAEKLAEEKAKEIAEKEKELQDSEDAERLAAEDEKKQYIQQIEMFISFVKAKEASQANKILMDITPILQRNEVGSITLLAFETLLEEIQKLTENSSETKQSDNKLNNSNPKKTK